jgi:hypothetical protein
MIQYFLIAFFFLKSVSISELIICNYDYLIPIDDTSLFNY